MKVKFISRYGFLMLAVSLALSLSNRSVFAAPAARACFSPLKQLCRMERLYTSKR
jgi:hypothetical protein